MAALSVPKCATGSAKRSRKPADDAAPVVKNPLSTWDFIAQVLYSNDFAKVFSGSGEIVGWALTSPPASTQYAFNIVLSGPRSKGVFNYSVDLGGPRTTSFNSMKAFYKKMCSFDENLPKELLPCNVAILWERPNGDDVETRVISMTALAKAFRVKVKKNVEGAQILLDAFEHGLCQLSADDATPSVATASSSSRRRSPPKNETTKADGENKTVAKETAEPESEEPPTSTPPTKKRKRPSKAKSVVEPASEDTQEPEPVRKDAVESSAEKKPSSPPRKKTKTSPSDTLSAVPTHETQLMNMLTLATSSINGAASAIEKTVMAMHAITVANNETSQKVMEFLLRMESANAKSAAGKRGKLRLAESDDDSGSESDDMDVNPNVPLTPPSPREVDEKTVEKSSTGRPLRQVRHRPLIDPKNVVDDMDEVFPSDEEEKKAANEESDSEYEDVMGDFMGKDTDQEIDEVDDGDEEEEEEKEEESDDDMEVADEKPSRKPYLKNGGSGTAHAPEYSDSSPDGAMHPESSMEDKVYNDDNDTLGAAPSSRAPKASLPLPKAPAVANLPDVKKAAPMPRKPLTITSTKIAPKPLPASYRESSSAGGKPSTALSASSKPFHVLTPPPAAASQVRQESCEDVINSTMDDDDLDTVDM